MKTEELLERQAYDKEYQWICTNCNNPLKVKDVRWGDWRNGQGRLIDSSICCDAKIELRI